MSDRNVSANRLTVLCINRIRAVSTVHVKVNEVVVTVITYLNSGTTVSGYRELFVWVRRKAGDLKCKTVGNDRACEGISLGSAVGCE